MRACVAAVAVAALSSSAFADRVVFVNANQTTGANDGTSWANAYRGRLGLQAAMVASVAGDELWVAQGTYAPAAANGTRTTSFEMRSGVALYGGFSGSETAREQRDPVARIARLTGDLNSNGNSGAAENDNSFHVVVASGVDASAVLDGFTLTGGVTTCCTLEQMSGGGLQIRGGATPIVRRCVFTANMADWYGGDIAVIDSSPLVEGCTFSGTSSGRMGLGVSHTGTSAAVVRGCRFIGMPPTTGGTAGVGIYSSATSAAGITVEECDFSIVTAQFSCPAGVGIHITEGSRATVRDCRFVNNITCGGGGGIHCDGIGTVDRCIFIGNEGQFDGGAAFFSFEGETTISNCVFVGNDRTGFSTITAQGVAHFVNCTFASNGGTNAAHFVVISTQAASAYSNCIFWGNRSSQGDAAAVVFRGSGTLPVFSSCLVQGWNGTLPGANNFLANPMFVNFTGVDGVPGTMDDDLRLGAGSPAIDRGNNFLVPMGIEFDLDHAPRRRDEPGTVDMGIGAAPIVDLGAYEVQPACRADFDQDGAVNSADFFAFVSAFFGETGAGDFNGDGVVDSRDFFEFVAVFFVGC